MSTGTITASGVGSGIDILGLVDDLVAAERQGPEQLLNRREETLDGQISALGQLKSALSTFQDSLTSFSSLNEFLIYSGSSSDEEVATVSADSSAVAGSFNLVLDSSVDASHQMATAHKLITAGFADAETTAVGTGSLTISNDNGDSFTVDITADANTLNDVRDAINTSADNTGASATVLNVSDGAGGTVSKLILTANDTGEDNALTVTADAGLSAFSSANLTEITAAQNAVFSIDGETIISASNTVTDAISGVSIELLGEGSSTLELTTDQGAIVESVQAFVDAYNTLQGVINETTAYQEGNPAPLFSDNTIKGLIGSLRSILISSVSTSSGTFSALSEIGITTSATGTLELDEDKLNQALSTDRYSVGEIFTNETDGIIPQLDAKLEPYTRFAGLLDSKTDSLNSRMELIDSARDRLDYRLTKLQERLQAQFIAMDALVQSLNSTGSFLLQQLSGTPVANNNRNN